MSAQEQYEEFYRWLSAKFDEADLALEENLAVDGPRDLSFRYARLLKRTADEMVWTARQIKELQNA